MTTTLKIPVFNNSQDVVLLKKGTLIGIVKVNDQNIPQDILISSTFSEVFEAIKSESLVAEELPMTS